MFIYHDHQSSSLSPLPTPSTKIFLGDVGKNTMYINIPKSINNTNLKKVKKLKKLFALKSFIYNRIIE